MTEIVEKEENFILWLLFWPLEFGLFYFYVAFVHIKMGEEPTSIISTSIDTISLGSRQSKDHQPHQEERHIPNYRKTTFSGNQFCDRLGSSALRFYE